MSEPVPASKSPSPTVDGFYRHTPSRRVYLILALAMTVLIGAMIYVLQTCNRVVLRHAPIIDAALRIRLETASAHLWLEELLAGDRHESIDDVRRHLASADWYARAMLEGGQNEEGTFYPLTDPDLRKAVEDTRKKLAEFAELSEQRYRAGQAAGSGTPIDRRYDTLFRRIIEINGRTEAGVRRIIAAETWTFQRIQILLICAAILLAALMAVTLRRHEVNRRRTKRRIEHLNGVLRAIRNVNQLITKEKDRYRLIRGACDCLTETHDCYNAWIALVDWEGKFKTMVGSELGEGAVPLLERLQSGKSTFCGTRALAEPGVVQIDDVAAACEDCPLGAGNTGRRALAVRLEQAGRIFGWLTLSYPSDFVADKTEQELVKEVAGDIAFALHSIEGEEAAKLVEAEAHASQEREVGILESISDGFFALDRNMVVTYFNKAAEELLGRKAEEVVGRHLFNEAFPEAKGTIFEREYDQALRLREHTSFETYFDSKLYSNWYEVRVYPYKEGISVYFQVTTERKTAEEERERMIAELEAKNAELERFAYTVSHDLKSPLITIRGFLGLLEVDIAGGDEERIRENISRIGEAADKMHQLLNELLELSRIGRLVGAPQSVPLGDLVTEVLELVAGKIGKKGVEISVDEDLPVLFGDRQRLREVLQNLVDNAVTHTGRQTRPRIRIGGEYRDDRAVCYVRDNGPGIDPSYQEKIFGLFDRLDPQSDGTGIGLALAKRIVEVHEGKIWVESQGDGQGATFYFSIPVEKRNE